MAYRANLKYESAQSSMVMTAAEISKIEKKKELVSLLVKQEGGSDTGKRS